MAVRSRDSSFRAGARALQVALLLAAAMPAHGVSIRHGIVPEAAPPALASAPAVRRAPGVDADDLLPPMHLGAGVTTRAGDWTRVAAGGEPHDLAAARDRARDGTRNDAGGLQLADLPTAGRRDAEGESVAGFLRSVVSAAGAPGKPAAPGAARASPAARRGHDAGDEPLLGLLEPLALGLLESSIAHEGVVGDKVVFSVLGQGAFVLEAARDGSGLAISELGSGARLSVGAPLPAAGGRQQAQAAPVAVAGPPLGWSDPALHDSPLVRAVDAVAGAVDATLRMLAWLGTSPAALLVLLPLILAALLIEALRKPRPAPTPGAARAQLRDRAAGARVRQRRHRRSQPARRRGVLRDLARVAREAVGFADGDPLHGCAPGRARGDERADQGRPAQGRPAQGRPAQGRSNSR